jgi:hypothetical protein
MTRILFRHAVFDTTLQRRHPTPGQGWFRHSWIRVSRYHCSRLYMRAKADKAGQEEEADLAASGNAVQ